MTRYRVQGLDALEEEMRAVARGERPAPSVAARASFNSAEALLRLLTPENRRLLALIRDRRPGSIVELSNLSRRAPSNVTRTLGKLEAAGLVRMETIDRRKVPTVQVTRLRLEIDPCSDNDQLEIA